MEQIRNAEVLFMSLGAMRVNEITTEELHEICELTVKLTALRQNECKHLSVENVAPEIFRSLLISLNDLKSGLVCITGDGVYALEE